LQGVLSALILLVILCSGVWLLPDSAIKQKLMPNFGPLAISAGLEQSWSVFAPNPPRVVEYLDVTVTLRSGREVTWNIPHGDPVIGHYATYHWQKLKEHLAHEPARRPGLAHWVARHEAAAAGEPAIAVRMILRTQSLPPPGSKATPTVTTRLLYSERLGG
jgi:hypothetical protein